MMMLHYDNAMLTQSYLSKTSFKKVPYSPGLALCDFRIFGTVKTQFEGREFESEYELFEELEKFFKGKSKDFYISLFLEWERRLHKCIDLNGEYVE